jgi:hypothetical protein
VAQDHALRKTFSALDGAMLKKLGISRSDL